MPKWVMVILALGAAGPVAADPLFSTKGRAGLFSEQTSLLDGRLADQYRHSVRLRPDHGREGAGPAFRGAYRGEYLEPARSAARRHGVPEDLFLRLVQTESGWNPGAVSPKGARGLAQLMPGTAAMLGVNADNPLQNLEGGARYLRQQYERFGSWRLALAAYNAGPEAVMRHDGVPPFAETTAYVQAVWGR